MIPIPGDYLYGKVGPRWRVLLYGLNKRWIGAQAAVQFARRIDDENFSIDVMDVLETISAVFRDAEMVGAEQAEIVDAVTLGERGTHRVSLPEGG